MHTHSNSFSRKNITPGAKVLLWTCCGLCPPYPTPQLICEILMPNVVVLGGGVFGRCWGHKCGVLMNRIGALMKETLQSSLPFPPCEDRSRSCQSAKQRALTRTWPKWHSDLWLPASRTVRNKFLLSISYLVYATLNKIDMLRPYYPDGVFESRPFGKSLGSGEVMRVGL